MVDEYGSSVAQMDVSLPKLRDQDKVFSKYQSQYPLLDKKEVDVAAVLCANKAA